jgi:predicted porin
MIELMVFRPAAGWSFVNPASLLCCPPQARENTTKRGDSMRILTKLVAAALAMPVCGAALAADDDVVIMYGMGMPFLDNAKTEHATSTAPANRPSMVPASAYTGNTDGMRTRITVGTSALGFRGSERIADGWKVVWQMESAFPIDANTGVGWGGRDSKVGLLHPAYGEFFMGQWDTPYKIIALPTNPIRGGYVFDRNTLIGNPGFNVPTTTTQFTRVAGKADASFDRRQGNSVQYVSPTFAGFHVRLQHSVNEGKGQAVAGGPVISPTVTGAYIQYDRGTLSLRYAYDQHRDYFGMSQVGGSAGATATNTSSKDEGQKLVLLWTLGNTRVTGTFDRIKYHNDDSLATAINEYKRNAYYVVLEQRFTGGTQSVFGAYGRAMDGSCQRVNGTPCTTSGLGASFWNAGYIYRFSKKTEGFLFYYHLSNKESGTYNIQPAVLNPIAPGASVTGYGVGVQEFF